MNKQDRVTIYCVNENSFFGNVIAIEATLVEHGRVKYAQYDGAIRVVFRRPRQRLNRQIILTYKPYLLIVRGWGHGEVPDFFTEAKTGSDGVTVQQSKYSGHSSNWVKDFEAWLEPRLSKMDIIADYRGANTYEKKFT